MHAINLDNLIKFITLEAQFQLDYDNFKVTHAARFPHLGKPGRKERGLWLASALIAQTCGKDFFDLDTLAPILADSLLKNGGLIPEMALALDYAAGVARSQGLLNDLTADMRGMVAKREGELMPSLKPVKDKAYLN